nr:non-specific lipid-transfer protein 2-like [Ipomoea batatas]
MVVAVLMLLLAEAQFSSAACDVQQLTPCLSALTSNTNPSQLCCKRLNQQKPCFCQYLKNPSLKMYLNSPAAKKAAKTCKLSDLQCVPSSIEYLESRVSAEQNDDDALLRVLLRLGDGGGGNEAETPGERHDGDSIGEVRHRGGAVNPTKIGANLTKIEEIGNQHRAISKGPSMKGASTGWPHWAVESQASDLVMSIAFFVLFQIGFLQFISLRFEHFACC